jgi:hypothetical protein
MRYGYFFALSDWRFPGDDFRRYDILGIRLALNVIREIFLQVIAEDFSFPEGVFKG